MQKNFLDHYIRRKYLLCYSVFADRYPYVPFGAEAFSLPPECNFKFRIDLPDEESQSIFIQRLKVEQIPHLPDISKKESWWCHLIEPRDNESLSLYWFAVFFKVIVALFLLITSPGTMLQRLVRTLLQRALI